MSIVDMLLGCSDKIMERPESEFEVSRLSKVCGQPVVIRAHALTMKEIDDLPTNKLKQHVIVQACVDPDFSNKELGSKYTPEGRTVPLTPVEVVDRILQPGEIVNLYNGIMDLSGFGESAIKKIKKK